MNETPFFFPSHGKQLFGVLHRPETHDRVQAFVFCHPFAEEKLWAHRVFVSFARVLAALGYTVLRFDYRGYGDSEGDFANVTIRNQLEDIETAIEYVRSSRINVKDVGLLGYRLGATLALQYAIETRRVGALILWDPIQDGERYIQEFLRSNLTTQLAIYGEIRENRDKLMERLKSGERINVDGYDLTKAAFDSIAGLKPLAAKIDALRIPILLVQAGKAGKPKKESRLLAERLGASLDCVIEEPFWREIKQFYYRADNLFAATLTWLETIQ